MRARGPAPPLKGRSWKSDYISRSYGRSEKLNVFRIDGDEPEIERFDDGDAAIGAELRVAVLQMELHRLLGNAEKLRNLPSGLAPRPLCQHFLLARGERLGGGHFHGQVVHEDFVQQGSAGMNFRQHPLAVHIRLVGGNGINGADAGRAYKRGGNTLLEAEIGCFTVKAALEGAELVALEQPLPGEGAGALAGLLQGQVRLRVALLFIVVQPFGFVIGGEILIARRVAPGQHIAEDRVVQAQIVQARQPDVECRCAIFRLLDTLDKLRERQPH